jgi:geranylgeranyl diphosphate synthase type II
VTTEVEERLAAYGGATRELLERHLATREPRRWLWDLVTEYHQRGGKSIRPALCIATCRAFGGSLDDALPSAAAIELLHDAFLVHDDVEDESWQRRGAPTLHLSEGLPLAVNTGDAMLVAALGLLRTNRDRLGSRLAGLVSDEFDVMLGHTLGGQALELGWRRDVIVDLDDDAYLDLIMRKTCWYTTVNPMRVGTLIGGWGRVDLEPMIRFGFFLGAAFQIRDDLLNLEGDEREYGKELLGDLYEGKRTLMLIHLLRTADAPTRERLVAFLGCERSGRTATDVRWVLDLMHDHGSIEHARAFASGIAEAAHGAFDDAFATAPPSEDRRFVEGLISFMLDRAS